MKITLLKYFDRPALVGMDFNLSYADLFERTKRAEEIFKKNPLKGLRFLRNIPPNGCLRSTGHGGSGRR